MIDIPLSAGSVNAHQRFSMQIENNLLDFEIDYLSYLDVPAWQMNIYRDASPLVLGAMLVPGADVIAGFKTDIGALVFIGEEVTLDNLGIDNKLVWVSQ